MSGGRLNSTRGKMVFFFLLWMYQDAKIDSHFPYDSMLLGIISNTQNQILRILFFSDRWASKQGILRKDRIDTTTGI